MKSTKRSIGIVVLVSTLCVSQAAQSASWVDTVQGLSTKAKVLVVNGWQGMSTEAKVCVVIPVVIGGIVVYQLVSWIKHGKPQVQSEQRKEIKHADCARREDVQYVVVNKIKQQPVVAQQAQKKANEVKPVDHTQRNQEAREQYAIYHDFWN